MVYSERDKARGRERRWPVLLTISGVFLLLAMLPDRIRMMPSWLLYVMVIAVAVPILGAELATEKTLWPRLERGVTLSFCLIGGVETLTGLMILVSAMINQPAEISGLQLFSSSIAVWVINVLVFSLLYWQVDRGGPEARSKPAGPRPDWHFPAQDFPGEVPADWRPRFADYLFLGFSTSTAFSMTEAAPLTSRAKLLMMTQSLISLMTIVVVAARAINILSS